MKYININSKSGLVSKFADYIVNHIDEDYKSIIQVVYLGGFFIVKGLTESDKVLNLQEIRDSFVEKYQYLLFPHGITNINFIDIIQYSYNFKNFNDSFVFYNSEFIRYPQEVLDFINENTINVCDESIEYQDVITKVLSSVPENSNNSIIESLELMSIKSEFPYGYNLKSGRLNFFYSEYIFNQVLNTIGANKVTFKFTNKKNEEDDYNIKIISNSRLPEKKIESLILDVFDFNVIKFKNDFLTDFNLEYEIENQLNKPKWYIKDRLNDLIII